MPVEYDKYYQTENLFGNPYPELVDLYSRFETKGKLLDVGCGQGRNAIALASLGYDVTGIDNSKVGIEQLNSMAQESKLPIVGIVEDIFDYPHYDEFDFILLDSMFHFGAKEKVKEISFLNNLIDKSKINALITICIQNTGDKIKVLNELISNNEKLQLISTVPLIYKYEDKESNHSSETNYEMKTVKKLAHNPDL